VEKEPGKEENVKGGRKERDQESDETMRGWGKSTVWFELKLSSGESGGFGEGEDLCLNIEKKTTQTS